MGNILGQIGTFLGEQFARVSGEFTGHAENHEIHKSSAEIRSEITEEDIPESIARDTEVNTKIQTHDTSGGAHQDIRGEIANIKNVECSEYAEHLGTAADSYTKAQLDTKINRHIKGVSYDQGAAKFTFTFEDGTVAEVDTPVENAVKDARYDAVAGELVLTLVSGGEIRIAAAGMTKTYSGVASATTTVVVNAEGVISTDLKEGGVDVVHLSEVLRDALNGYQTKTGDTKDNNVTVFTEAAERENIQPGENHGVLFGKIRKWFSSLGGLAFRDSVEPLSINYENGDKIVYQGSEGQSILIPGAGRKVLAKGLNVHGYWEAEEYVNFSFSPLLIGISEMPPEAGGEEGGVFVSIQKVYYKKTTLSWEISTDYPIQKVGPLDYRYDINMMFVAACGNYRFAVYYVDPVTLNPGLIYSDIVYVHVVRTKGRDIVPLNNIGFAEGYEIAQLYAEVNFKLYGFSEAATSTLAELVNGEWVLGVSEPISPYWPYAFCPIDKVGRYKLIVTDAGVETSSGEFITKLPKSQLYVVTEYPQDLTGYADGTVFIKK